MNNFRQFGLKRAISSKIENENCPVCKEKPDTDRIVMAGMVFHTKCFKCATCGDSLMANPYGCLDGIYYCKPHYADMQKMKADPSNRGKTPTRSSTVMTPRTEVSTPRVEITKEPYTPSYTSPTLREPPKESPTSRPEAVSPSPAMRYGKKPLLGITISSAAGLLNPGLDALNAFVTLTTKKKVFKTQVRVKSAEPYWDETFEIQTDSRDESLKFQCWHQDPGALPDFLGQATCLVGELLDKIEISQSSSYDTNLPLKLSPTSDVGQLRLSFKTRYALSEKDEENRAFNEKFEKFLEMARFSPNDKKVLSSLRLDEKRKKFKDLVSLRAKEYSEIIKTNKNVPKEIVKDLKALLSEKTFLTSFVSSESNVDGLVYFLSDPKVVDTPAKPFPDTQTSSLPTQYTSPKPDATTRTKTAITRTSSVQSNRFSFTPVDLEPEKIVPGLSYSVSGRSSQGGSVGKPCIFSVFFKIDGVPVPDPTKSDLVLHFECPGDTPPTLVNVGTGGGYQIGLTPKVGGQHWIDFVWKGQWCKEPFLLPVFNAQNAVPEFPYTGTARAAATASSPTSKTDTPSTEPEKKTELNTKTEDKEEATVPIKPEDQHEARILIIEIIRDILLTRIQGAAHVIHPNVIESIFHIALAKDKNNELLTAFYALLAVLRMASSSFDSIVWDGGVLARHILSCYQGEESENPFTPLVTFLRKSGNPSQVASVLVLIHQLLEADNDEDHQELKSVLLSCNFLAVLQSLKLRFPKSEGIRRNASFEGASTISPSDNLSVTAVSQVILENSDKNVTNSYLNIMRSLLQISKEKESQARWKAIEYIATQVVDQDWRNKRVLVSGVYVPIEKILKDIGVKEQLEEKLHSENITKTAEIDRLNRLLDEYFKENSSLRSQLNVGEGNLSKPTAQFDISFNTTEESEASHPYNGPKSSFTLNSIPIKDYEGGWNFKATIFSSLNPNKVNLDAHSLEKMFAEDPMESKHSLLSKPRVIQISQSMQALYNMPYIQQKILTNTTLPEILKELASSTDNSNLNNEIIQHAVSLLPSSDEVSRLKQWKEKNSDADASALNSSDALLLSLINLDENLESKFKALSFFYSTKQSLMEVRKCLDVAKAASQSLLKSKEIPQLLEILLAIINFVNPTSANSFHIELLKNLKNIFVSSDYSLLDYLVKVVEKDYPQLKNWTDNIQPIALVNSIPWDSVKTDLATLSEEVLKTKVFVNAIPSQEYQDKFSFYEKEVQQANEMLNSINKEWEEELTSYFAVSKNNPSKVFEIFGSFSRAFKDALLRQREGVSFASHTSNEPTLNHNIEEVSKLLSNKSSANKLKNLLKATATPSKHKITKISSSMIGTIILAENKK